MLTKILLNLLSNLQSTHINRFSVNKKILRLFGHLPFFEFKQQLKWFYYNAYFYN